MIVSFVIAGVAAGLAAVCYAELAAAVPVSGSSYSYAYGTLGEAAAMGVAVCLLLEYGVSTAAVAVGWSGYVDTLLDNLFGLRVPQALSAAPWDAEPGWVNLPAVILIGLCALLLVRGTSESAKVNAVMVLIKPAVLAVFVVIAFGAFDAGQFRDFAPFATARSAPAVHGARLPCHAGAFGAGVRVHPRQSALVHLDRVRRLGRGGVNLIFYVVWGRHHSALNDVLSRPGRDTPSRSSSATARARSACRGCTWPSAPRGPSAPP